MAPFHKSSYDLELLPRSYFHNFLMSSCFIYVNSFWPKKCMKSVQVRNFFLVCIFLHPHSVQIQENTDQKKLRIWTLFTKWSSMLLKGVSRTLCNISDETFSKVINIWKPLTVSVKRSILDVWFGSEYVSVNITFGSIPISCFVCKIFGKKSRMGTDSFNKKLEIYVTVL